MNPTVNPLSTPPNLAATRDHDVRVVATRRTEATRLHWAEYGMEAALLGTFMISACLFAALLNHPASPVVGAVRSDFTRRALMGVAMGATALTLVHSPFGKRSGAHFNPAVTLTFYRLGKIARTDAIFYILAQFVGGAIAVMLIALPLHDVLSHHAVHYAVTTGRYGALVSFAAEAIISFMLMTVVLFTTNSMRLMRCTPLFVASLVSLYIVFEAPYSGMSMNPARSTASALAAHYFIGIWVYFTAPLLGMLTAAEVFLRVRHGARPVCAKLHHANNTRCIFRCGYAQAAKEAAGES